MHSATRRMVTACHPSSVAIESAACKIACCVASRSRSRRCLIPTVIISFSLKSINNVHQNVKRSLHTRQFLFVQGQTAIACITAPFGKEELLFEWLSLSCSSTTVGIQLNDVLIPLCSHR